MIGKAKGSDKVHIWTPDDCRAEMLQDLENGKVKGTTTYNDKLDNAWRWRPEEFTIWSGYANEGKSLFFKQLAAIKALNEGKKFAFWSPEDYPPKEFYDDLVHTISGITTDKDYPGHIKPHLYNKIVDLIKDLFYFVYINPPNNTIVGILETFRKLHEEVGLFGCVMDPLLKARRPKGAPERDDLYAGHIGGLCVDFARMTGTSLHLVMHQTTPQLNKEDRKYPEPSMYTMKGGGSWADGADNVNSIWRPEYAVDKMNDEVQFSSQKIKKQKLVGIPQRVKMRFDRRSNRFIDFVTGKPIWDFDKFVI